MSTICLFALLDVKLKDQRTLCRRILHETIRVSLHEHQAHELAQIHAVDERTTNVFRRITLPGIERS